MNYRHQLAPAQIPIKSTALLILRITVGVQPFWHQAMLQGESTKSVGTEVDEGFHVFFREPCRGNLALLVLHVQICQQYHSGR